MLSNAQQIKVEDSVTVTSMEIYMKKNLFLLAHPSLAGKFYRMKKYPRKKFRAEFRFAFRHDCGLSITKQTFQTVLWFINR